MSADAPKPPTNQTLRIHVYIDIHPDEIGPLVGVLHSRTLRHLQRLLAADLARVCRERIAYMVKLYHP